MAVYARQPVGEQWRMLGPDELRMCGVIETPDGDHPRPVQAEQILAFRLARSGLAGRDAGGLAEAAACPASDFSRDAALLAVAARMEGRTRDQYGDAVDDGDLVVAHVVRDAIHALAPGDLALYGRALLSGNHDERSPSSASGGSREQKRGEPCLLVLLRSAAHAIQRTRRV